MILGMGTDIVENDRIREVYEKHGRRFLNRIFTEEAGISVIASKI